MRLNEAEQHFNRRILKQNHLPCPFSCYFIYAPVLCSFFDFLEQFAGKIRHILKSRLFFCWQIDFPAAAASPGEEAEGKMLHKTLLWYLNCILWSSKEQFQGLMEAGKLFPHVCRCFWRSCFKVWVAEGKFSYARSLVSLKLCGDCECGN